MFNFFKRKKKVFKCIYPWESYKDLFEVKPSARSPHNDVMKNVKPVEGANTIRRCPAFFKPKTNGFVLYQPFDFSAEVYSDGEVRLDVVDSQFLEDLHVHPKLQTQGYFKDYVTVKVNSPIYIRESSGVECVVLPPIVENIKLSNDIIVPTGIIDFRYNNVVNLFYMLRIPKEGSANYSFDAGDPAAQMLPLCEDWELKHEVNSSYLPVNNVMGVAYTRRHGRIKKLMDRGK